MNEIYIKWYDKLGDKFVKDTIAEFDFLEREFYEDRNKKQILDTYFQYESSIINKLRNENKLVNFLVNKDRKTLGMISNICDIKQEFNKVDSIKFEEEKRNRGKNITVNLNN